MTAPLWRPDGTAVLPGNRWDLLTGRQPAQPPTVSVVIPYFDAQQRLDLVLTALSEQRYPAGRVEVIVADDGSPAAPDLSAYRGGSAQLVRQPDRGFRAGAARNLGARAAGGDVLCFLDDDTVPEPDYLHELTRLPALTPDALVTGRRRHADLTGWTPDRLSGWLTGAGPAPVELTEPDWLVDEHRRSANLLRLHPLSHRFVISAVLACSRSLFTELEGFCEDLTSYGGEDWELAHRALCAGAVLAHVPAAVAWHDGSDWALRGTAEDRRRQKNAETAALAALIGDPGRADRGWTGRPDVAVTLAAGAEEYAALVCIRSLLAAGLDCGIWVEGASAAALAGQHFGPDPRIQVGPPAPSATAAARTLVHLDRPLRIEAPAWPQLLARVGPGGVGRLHLHTGDGTLTVTAAGAAARAARWSAGRPTTDLIELLFGSEADAGAAYGVSPVPRAPDVAHELSHLADIRAQPCIDPVAR